MGEFRAQKLNPNTNFNLKNIHSNVNNYNNNNWTDVDIFHTADNYLIICEGIFDNGKKPLNLISLKKCKINKNLQNNNNNQYYGENLL